MCRSCCAWLTAIFDRHFSVPVIGKTEANVASWQQRDSLLLTRYLNRDALLKDLDAEITALSAKSDATAMTIEEKALADIASKALAVDRELSELIWKAQADNLPIEFRSDANPLALLGRRLVTVAPTKELPPTTPGHAYDVVGPGRR